MKELNFTNSLRTGLYAIMATFGFLLLGNSLSAQCNGGVTGLTVNQLCDGTFDVVWNNNAPNNATSFTLDLQNGGGISTLLIPNMAGSPVNISAAQFAAAATVTVTANCPGGASASTFNLANFNPPPAIAWGVQVGNLQAPTCPGGNDGSYTVTITAPAACLNNPTVPTITVFTQGVAGPVVGPAGGPWTVVVNGMSAGAQPDFDINAGLCGICPIGLVQNIQAGGPIPAAPVTPLQFDVTESFPNLGNPGNNQVITAGNPVANTVFQLPNNTCAIGLEYFIDNLVDPCANQGNAGAAAFVVNVGGNVNPAVVTGPDANGRFHIELDDIGPGNYGVTATVTNINTGNITTRAWGITILAPPASIIAGDDNVTIPSCQGGTVPATYAFAVDGGCVAPAAATVNGVAATPNGNPQGSVQNFFINLPNIAQGNNFLVIQSAGIQLTALVNGILIPNPAPAILAFDENVTIPACVGGTVGITYSFSVDGGCVAPAAATVNGVAATPNGAAQGAVQNFFINLPAIGQGPTNLVVASAGIQLVAVVNGILTANPAPQIIVDAENVQIPACAANVPVVYSFNVDGGCAAPGAATVNGQPANFVQSTGTVSTFSFNLLATPGPNLLNIVSAGTNAQGLVFATRETTPVPAIIAADDNVTIPVCNTTLTTLYSFSVDGGCFAPGGATVNGIAATQNGAAQGTVQNYQVTLPNLQMGANNLNIAVNVNGNVLNLTTRMQLNQQQNLGPQIIYPDEVQVQIPVCDQDKLFDSFTTNIQATDDCDGSVVPVVTGINGPAGYTLVNTGANGTRTLTFTNLAPGTYTVSVTATDAHNNVATNPGNFTFTVLPAIEPVASPFSCSEDQRITMAESGVCTTTIFPSQLLVGNSLCPHIEAQVQMTAHIIENHHSKKVNAVADSTGRTGTGSIMVSTPGKYHYTLKLNIAATATTPARSEECWGTFILEDKSAPICMPAGDAEPNLTVCGVANQPDPSGVDDLRDEVVSSYVVDKYGKDALEPWFDILDKGDFKDCSDLMNIEYTTTKATYCGNYAGPAPNGDAIPAGWEVCFVFTRTWTAYDWKGMASAQPCSQKVFVVRPMTLRDPDPKITKECGSTDPVAAGPSFVDLGAGMTCPQNVGKRTYIASGQTLAKWTATHVEGLKVELCDDKGADCSKSFKQFNKWIIVDLCRAHINPPVEKPQTLVNEDKTAPTITPKTIQVWTNPFDCTTSMTGEFTTSDACSSVIGSDISATYQVKDPWGKVIKTVKEDLAGNKLTLQNVPLGVEVTFTYRAWDCCGNMRTSSTKANSEDGRAPVCVANDELEVGLIITDHDTNSNGKIDADEHSVGARIYPEDLDDTSKDNCYPLKMEIRKVTNGVPGPWGPYVEYSYKKDSDFNQAKCVDVQWVDLRITEIRTDGKPGLSTVCQSKLTLRDNNAPRYTSDPQNKAQDCFAKDIKFDAPGVWGFCVNTTYKTDTTIYHCPTKVGGFDKVIAAHKRVWTTTKMTEHDMFTIRDSQTIYITEKREEVFTFPFDFKGECTTTFPTPTKLDDILVNKGCSEWVMNVSEERFAGDEGACYKILRTYDFINWCLWDGVSAGSYISKKDIKNDVNQDDKLLAADGDKQVVIKTGNTDVEKGRFKYLQIIKIIDNSDPTGSITNVVGCDGSTAGCDQGTVDFTVNFADVCSTPSITDWYINTPGSKGGFTAAVQADGSTKVSRKGLGLGKYKLHVRVDDECGNFIWLVNEAEVKKSDCKKPTLILVPSVTKVMPETTPKMVQVWLSDVLVSHSDNCAGPYTFAIENMRTSTGSMPTTGTTTNPAEQIAATFVCPEDNGGGLVRVWMRDAQGNVQYVDAPVVLQGGCDGAAQAAVAGKITNENDDMIDEVTIEANGTGFTPFTDLFDGLFSLNVPMSSDVTVTPTKDMNHLNGVSGADLVALQRHILGIKPLTSAYQMIAADVSGDERVNTVDMLHVTRLILGIYDELPNVDSWRFIDKSYTFADPTSPWGFPESIDYADLSGDEKADFIGVKMGDLTGNAIAANILGTDDTKIGDMTMAINDATIKAGQTHTIEFTAKDFNDFTGYQLSIELANGVTFEGAKVGDLPNHSEGNFGLNRLADNVITTNWANADAVNLEDGAVLFSISVSASTDVNVSEAIKITSTVTAAEAYNSDLETFGIQAQFNRADAKFALYQNTPNPFSAETQIAFELDKAGAASLKIMDVSGRVLKQINGTYTAGYHQITLNKSDLGATGVLYYQLDTDTNSATKKMVILE